MSIRELYSVSPESCSATLLCCPPAGAGASFFRFLVPFARLHACTLWAAEYPGHETRHREPFVRSRREIVEEIVRDLADRGVRERSCLVVGHSLGAQIAFEVAAASKCAGAVVLSGRSASFPGTAPPAPSPEGLSDDAVCRWLRELGGTPQEALEHPVLRQMIARVVRADLVLALEPSSSSTLDVPLWAVIGDNDPAGEWDSLLGWSERTSSVCERVLLSGDHDALRTDRAAFEKVLEEALKSISIQGNPPLY